MEIFMNKKVKYNHNEMTLEKREKCGKEVTVLVRYDEVQRRCVYNPSLLRTRSRI